MKLEVDHAMCERPVVIKPHHWMISREKREVPEDVYRMIF